MATKSSYFGEDQWVQYQVFLCQVPYKKLMKILKKTLFIKF